MGILIRCGFIVAKKKSEPRVAASIPLDSKLSGILGESLDRLSPLGLLPSVSIFSFFPSPSFSFSLSLSRSLFLRSSRLNRSTANLAGLQPGRQNLAALAGIGACISQAFFSQRRQRKGGRTEETSGEKAFDYLVLARLPFDLVRTIGQATRPPLSICCSCTSPRLAGSLPRYYPSRFHTSNSVTPLGKGLI